jgi:hypothetical protein
MMKTNPIFDERLKKVQACINHENEHVVGCYMGQGVPPTYSDITLAKYITDTDAGLKCFIDFVNRMNAIASVDSINFGYPGLIRASLSMMWWSKVKMPGEELGENEIWQVDERKLIQDSDYELIIKEGSAAVRNRILPQVIDMKEIEQFFEYHAKDDEMIFQQYTDAGYPVLTSGVSCPPFETLCGGRSMSAFFMDCYRKPDLIKEAQDVMLEEQLKMIASRPVSDYVIGEWIGGWRGASGLVSPKIWDKLVWPYMNKIAVALIDRGITPILHLDQNWDRDLERFLELPAKKCIINTDGMTDLRKARKVLGNHVAFMGDVPSQMLVVSTPDEVKDYIRRLLDDIGVTGVFLAAGCDAPTKSKFENLVAIHEVAQEY